MSLAEAIKIAMQINIPTLFNEDIDLRHPVPGSQLVANLTKEVEQYFTTGNSRPHQDGSGAKCVNPTLLQPMTGKWLVHQASCPFFGYAPLPLKELDGIGKHNGIAFDYCRTELKKLLIAFRKKKERITFHFHSCEPMAFCYQYLPLVFDVIDGSSILTDNVGLVNLLNAAARKLRSDQSVLFTASLVWPLIAPDVAHYIQNVLCCPLSLIPTIYGLQLMDNVELGPDNFITTRNGLKSFCRLRWKKAQPFEGIAPAMSPHLEQCLERLKKLCFRAKVEKDVGSYGTSRYSPLTFHYVMCDLIRRGGLPVTSMEVFRPPSAFRTAVEAVQAWKERRSVWMADFCFKLSPMAQTNFDEIWNTCNPILRLILMPHSAFLAVAEDVDKFFEIFTSPDSLYIDNVELKIKLKTDGSMEAANISFLLADRNLLQTHIGIVVDDTRPLFVLSPKASYVPQVKVDKFSQPHPYWIHVKKSTAASPGSSSDVYSNNLMAISCQESQDTFTLRLSFRSGHRLPRSGRRCKHTKFRIRFLLSIHLFPHLFMQVWK